MERKAFAQVQGASGFVLDDDACFCYFETDTPIHTITELIKAAKGRRPSNVHTPHHVVKGVQE